MKKRTIPAILMLALILSACIPSVEHPPKVSKNGTVSPEIRVYADTALEDALAEIAANYQEAHPEAILRLSFSNSKHLRELIETGKSGDLFVSANPDETATLVDDGYILPDATRVLATSRLVIAVPAGNPGNIQSANDLSRPGLKIGLVAEGKPTGEQTRSVLENLNALYGGDYSDLTLANVQANAETGRELLDQLRLEKIDVCIVNSYDAANNPDFSLLDLPADMNSWTHFDVSILAKSGKQTETGDFMNYMLSPEGTAVLTEWGFTVP